MFNLLLLPEHIPGWRPGGWGGGGGTGGLMVNSLDSGSNGLGSSAGHSHSVVFLGKTIHSHSASLHSGVCRRTVNLGNGTKRWRWRTYDGLPSMFLKIPA